MTPAGRWVARIRWRPSERPRWATLTTPSTNSGTSWTSAANSSTTITRLGGLSGSPRRSSSSEVLGLLAVQDVLAVAQLGAQATQRPTNEVRAEVGDEPDAVRQVDAVGECRTALVVDEQEVQPVRGCAAAMPRIQLWRNSLLPAPVVPPTSACGPFVRRSREADPFRSARRAPAGRQDSRWVRPAIRHGGRGCGSHAAGEHHLRVVAGFRSDDRHDGHRPRQVGVVVDGCTGVQHGREAAGEGRAHLPVQRLAGHRSDGPAGANHADVRASPVGQVQEGASRARDVAAPLAHPHHVHPGIGPELGDAGQSRHVRGGVVGDDEHRGHDWRSLGPLARLDGPARLLPTGLGAQRDQLLDAVEEQSTRRLVRGEELVAERRVRRGRVGQPLQPRPLRLAARRREAGDHELCG